MGKQRKNQQQKPNRRRGKNEPSTTPVQPTPISTEAKSRTFWQNHRLHIVLIFVFGFVLYGNTITHDYALDDSIVIVDNEFTKKGISGIGEILSYDTFTGFFGKQKDLVAGGRYRPMSLVTFAVEWQLFGENPSISHFINILMYGGVGAVLYLLLLQMMTPQGRKKPDVKVTFLALATTALFMAHPIHTEAVANIKGRDEIMSLLGSLLALYWSFRYLSTQKIAYLLGSALVFFIGLMSKENAITFLAIAPVAFYFFSSVKTGKIVVATAPYALMAGIFLFIRASVLGDAASIGGEEAQELMNNPFIGLTASERYGTIFYTLGRYIQLLIFPHPLTHDYYPRHIPIMNFGDISVLLSIGLYVGMGLIAIWGLFTHQRGKNTLLATISFGIIFYLAALSIVSNLLFSIGTNMSERLIFMPSVGFCLIVAALVSHFLIKKEQLQIAVIATAAVCLLFTIKTITRNPAWADNYTLFKTDIATAPNSAKLNNAMGGVTIEEAQKPENAAKKDAMLNEAIQYLAKATEIHPTYANAYLLSGNAFFYKGNYSKAAEYYKYIAETFDNPNGQRNLLNVGKKMVEQGQFLEAIPVLESAKSYHSTDFDLYGNLGAAYGQTNQHLKAIENFQEVIKLQPNNAKAHLFIGYAYMNLSETNPNYRVLAEEFISKAKAIDPNVQ